MSNLNLIIYKNITEILKDKNTNIGTLSKKGTKARTTLLGKYSRLEKGLGITTNTLEEIADLLEVPVYFLIK